MKPACDGGLRLEGGSGHAAGEELSDNCGSTAKQYRCRCGAQHGCGSILDPQYG